ncbi:MAG: hypothetical protein ACO1OX_04500 [Novosphingobium sp.]
MNTIDEVREAGSLYKSTDFNEVVDAADVAPHQPIEITIVPEWMPVDPARSIEAAVLAVFLVAGWALAIWAYVQMTT